MSELADSTVNMLMSGQKSLASWWMDDALATFEAREKLTGYTEKVATIEVPHG